MKQQECDGVFECHPLPFPRTEVVAGFTVAVMECPNIGQIVLGSYVRWFLDRNNPLE